MLVQNGADIDARDGFFYTPLHLACVNGAVACVEVLLLAGADPGTRAQGGVTPLIAARKPEVRELVKEALATRKGSLWEVDVSGQSAADVGTWQRGGEGQGAVTSGGGGNTAAAASTTAGLAAALAAVLATTSSSSTAGAAGGMDVEETSEARRESESWASHRSDWDAEMPPTLGSGAVAAAAGKVASPRGRPMSRLPREKETRRAGTSARPRRSSTGSMLEKLFNSSSGPYQPQKIKDEEAEEVAAMASTTTQMVSISLASSMESSTEASTESSGEDEGDSHSSGAVSAAPAEGGDGIPDAFEAAAEVPVVSAAQMIPETPLHLAPRRPPSPRRSLDTTTATVAAAAVPGKTVETVALDLPQFVGAPLDMAPAHTLPRVVSAEDGDVQQATEAVAASAEPLQAPGVASSPLASPDEPAPAPVEGAGAVRDGAKVGGSSDPVGGTGVATATVAAAATAAAAAAAAAPNTTPAVAAARRGSNRRGREKDERAAAEAAPARVRAKKRRAKSLPPSTRRDRRPRGPRPCLEGPSAVIKTLTLEDDEDGNDGEAWALSQWLHAATGSATAAAADGGGGGDSPPPSPGMLPLRRATTLVG